MIAHSLFDIAGNISGFFAVTSAFDQLDSYEKTDTANITDAVMFFSKTAEALQ